MNIEQQTVGEFLEALAAKSPTPGGGAVASVTASIAAALAQMVLRYSQGKKSLAEHAQLHETSLDELQQLGADALALAQADAEAYGKLNTLWKLDKDDPVRQREWVGAVSGAIDAPRRVMLVSVRMLERFGDLVGKTNAMLDSDLAIAAVLADAGVRAGAWNVRINLPLVDDADAARQLGAEIEAIIERSRDLCDRVERASRKNADDD